MGPAGVHGRASELLLPGRFRIPPHIHASAIVPISLPGVPTAISIRPIGMELPGVRGAASESHNASLKMPLLAHRSLRHSTYERSERSPHVQEIDPLAQFEEVGRFIY